MFIRLAITFLRLFISYLANTPLRFNLWLARCAADFTYYLRIRRRKLIDNLDHVYGDTISPARKREIAFHANRNLFMTAVEMLRSTHPKIRSFEKEVTYSNEPLMYDLDEDPRSTIFAASHSGNFDLSGCWWTQHMKRPLWAVAKPLNQEEFNQFLNQSRNQFGFHMISSKGERAINEINRVIERGEHLCILPDQYARKSDLKVDFLGKPAKTFKGAAATYLQNREKCRLVTAVPVRVGDSKNHVIYVREITDFTPSGDWEEDLKNLTQRICDDFSEVIWKHPESYLWHHGRWGRLRTKKGILKSEIVT